MAHRGVEATDPRNTGVLALLAPADLSDAAVVRERLTRMLRGASAAKIEESVAKVLGAKGAPPPVSQSLQSVADPQFGLNTHPDLVSRLWALDDTLPERCRWVIYGHPALVQPRTGVVFGFAGGTLGYALRLPEAARREADALGAKATVKRPFEPPCDVWAVSKAGPEWRLCGWWDREPDWCRAAYERAADPG
jgi:hypothetical protein